MWAQRSAEEFLRDNGENFTNDDLIAMSEHYESLACFGQFTSLREYEQAFRRWVISIHVCCTARTPRRDWVHVTDNAA
jgi:hypothetical protein